MTILKLALLEDVCWYDQNHYTIHEKDTEREIAFGDDGKFAVILPIEHREHGDYQCFATEADTLKESSRLSALGIGHQIIDTDGMNYIRRYADDSNTYLEKFEHKELNFTKAA